jgi:hypothetical protein
MTNHAMIKECPMTNDAIGHWSSGIGRALLLTLCWLLVQPAGAQSLRVVTWELDEFETVSSEMIRSATDAQRLSQIAGHLKPLDADVIVLHGLTDLPSVKRLTGLLKPATYHVAHHSTFKKGASDSAGFGPSITILSRKPALTARSMDWRSTGQIDLPGGFVFAGLGSGANAWCVYVAHLPDDAAGGDRQALARKRELAAQYLAHHANWLSRTLTNQIASFYLTGDFIVDPKSARAEGAVRILQQAGFKSAVPGLPARKRISTTDDPFASPPRLTALLTRNADFVSPPQVWSRRPFEQPMVAYDLTPNAPPSITTAIPATNSASAREPASARFVTMDRDEVWLWAGGVAILLLAILISVWLVRRATPTPGTFSRRREQPVVMDLSGFAAAGHGDSASGRHFGESYSGSASGESHTEAAVWQARALQAEERASQAAGLVRSGLMPQLRRLMRERLIGWLTSQRGQLLTSHEVGTQQMLELEERLQRIQGQFQDSLQTREQRIAELEVEILAKERIIRDLLRAQVRVADESANP